MEVQRYSTLNAAMWLKYNMWWNNLRFLHRTATDIVDHTGLHVDFGSTEIQFSFYFHRATSAAESSSAPEPVLTAAAAGLCAKYSWLVSFPEPPCLHSHYHMHEKSMNHISLETRQAKTLHRVTHSLCHVPGMFCLPLSLKLACNTRQSSDPPFNGFFSWRNICSYAIKFMFSLTPTTDVGHPWPLHIAYTQPLLPTMWIKPCLFAWDSSPHLLVIPAHLMRPGIGRNVSYTADDFVYAFLFPRYVVHWLFEQKA